MDDLPEPIADLVQELSAMPGIVALALGGSRALGITDAGTDWDLGLYYRDTIDLTALATHGTVHLPGSWGRMMNGGAWLEIGGERVDVLLRDLTVVEHWTARAERGEFEVDALPGYTAGVPTYLLTAELALGRVLYGTLPTVSFPPALAAAAPHIWRFCRSFSIEYARVHATRGNHVGAVAQAAKAVTDSRACNCCSRACRRRRRISSGWVDAVADRLGVPPGDAMPWKPRAPESR
jgi:hypothetical protein